MRLNLILDHLEQRGIGPTTIVPSKQVVAEKEKMRHKLGGREEGQDATLRSAHRA